MTPHLRRLIAVLRHPDADWPDEIFPPAIRDAILAGILATEPRGSQPLRPWQRLSGFSRGWRRVSLPLSAGLAACAVLVTLIFLLQPPQPVAAGVSFRSPASGPDGGYIIATVTDPFAAQASLNAAFRQEGLDIKVTLVPASPSAVGTVVFIDQPPSGNQIEALSSGPCVSGGSCPIGVKIPRDFTGSGSITLGRPAKAGEQYESSNDAFAPGELLHCSDLIGETVAVASAELAERKISIELRQDGSGAQPSPDEYVVDGIPNSANSVFLFVQPTPPSSAVVARDAQVYSRGCSSP